MQTKNIKIKDIFIMCKESKNLNEKNLEKVTGGENLNNEGIITVMKCSNCGKNGRWGGYYYMETFDCPNCGQHTFKGVSIIETELHIT